MAMYFYASKISAIACGTRSKQTVLQKSRGQRDRDKDIYRQRGCLQQSSDSETSTDEADSVKPSSQFPDVGIFSLDVCSSTVETTTPSSLQLRKALEQENECAAQLDASELELGFRQFELTNAKSIAMGAGNDTVQYDVPKNSIKLSQCDINFESSVLGSGGIMYINGKIVSGPLDSFTDVLIPKNVNDLDKEFLFSFLLSSRLFLRPHELLGKLLDSVPDSECLETLVALLAEWTQKFPYDYRDERMMNHIKHIVARCSNSHLEAAVSQVLSALLNRLTDLEGHEADLRACQISNDKLASALNCTTATQYAQVLCRLEKKLAKHIGPEEFLQCSSLVLLDKQKWDQPSSSAGPQGAQDPKKTCNLETYLDWSARLRLFVCNEILQCRGIEERSRTVEVWSGVAQYCLLVGNYNSATAILESLESPAISRLKITWSKLQVTCQQLDCMQRHAEGHGHLWHKQTIVLNEQHPIRKTDKQTVVSITNEPSLSPVTTVANEVTTTDSEAISTCASGRRDTSGLSIRLTSKTLSGTTTTETVTSCGKPNDWVVIPVFADIVKLALVERENCLQRLPNGHFNIAAFDRIGAIVGAFTKHMHSMKLVEEPSICEYASFCSHMQQTSKLGEAELMMASFACEEPNNAEKMMYDLN
ncbi:uncharacterized protein LOC6567062 isoform X2 [Drosophila grimshawi]|uniref:uncharacterized protein LOC6567062 isoform X2 n=1 Tax=Drosophila grimshawi TaxID=7222 RepID=UPI000C871205|nr:uncharacterized protein LOC6567062 isoform X2 [Drosophila grimshawi]